MICVLVSVAVDHEFSIAVDREFSIAVDREFNLMLAQFIDYEIGICCFNMQH